MYQEFHKVHEPTREEILHTLLKLMLLKAEQIKQTLLPQEKNSEWLELFIHFRQQLEQQFRYTRNANEYAQMLNVSYKHLNTICKAIIDRTAKSFIDEFVILEAKRQLASTDHTIQQVSYHLGFEEPTNFVKYFKKHTQLSPNIFRQQLLH